MEGFNSLQIFHEHMWPKNQSERRTAFPRMFHSPPSGGTIGPKLWHWKQSLDRWGRVVSTGASPQGEKA